MSSLSDEQKQELKKGLHNIINTTMQFARQTEWNPHAEIMALAVVVEAENLIRKLNK